MPTVDHRVAEHVSAEFPVCAFTEGLYDEGMKQQWTVIGM